jgi:hypothetical protein
VCHGFEDDLAPGSTIPGVAASVLYERIGGSGNRLIHVTFPYDLASVWDPAHLLTKAPPGLVSARSKFLEEVLGFIGAGPADSGNATGAPPMVAAISDVHVDPNPFNPATQISYRSTAPGPHRVTVYDLRGRVVRVLLQVDRPAGTQQLEWNGRDQTGSEVASGVYLVEIRVARATEVRKVALVR